MITSPVVVVVGMPFSPLPYLSLTLNSHCLTCNPIHSNAFHSANAIGHHILSPCLVPLGPTNGAQAHIHPIDGVILWRRKDVKDRFSVMTFGKLGEQHYAAKTRTP